MAFAECEKQTEWEDTFVEFYDRRNEGIAVRRIIYGSVRSLNKKRAVFKAAKNIKVAFKK